METKTTKFKVGDVVRITNPLPYSSCDKDKVIQIGTILEDAGWVRATYMGNYLMSCLFKEDELSLLCPEELPLWQLRFPTLK